jgi:two-component system sensor histidine kinase KdpD
MGAQRLGSLGAIGTLPSEAALQAITNLIAVAIEHARQQRALGRLEVARQNERLRGVLLDSLAHDFLTPLTSIKGAISTVRTEFDHGDEEKEFLAVVEEETDKLGEMINETTDIARIEPGKPRIRRRELAVAEVIDSALKRMRSSLDGHPLEINIQSNLSMIQGDPEMLGLALRQLISNASKYSPPEAAIEVIAFGSRDSATIQVRDHGPGIAPDEIESIFERFYRGKEVQDSVAGTGMGLSIARDIIHAHGGRIWVENAPGGGAQFSLKLPVSNVSPHI